jgi:ATP-dependent Clp protease ATP-binding subunit ClpB
MQYIYDRKLPDKAIDLIDEALSSVKLKSISKPVELDIIDKQIRSLEIEYEAKKNEKISKEKLQKLLKQIESKKEEAKIIEINWKKEKERIDSIHNSKEKIENYRTDAQNHERD